LQEELATLRTSFKELQLAHEYVVDENMKLAKAGWLQHLEQAEIKNAGHSPSKGAALDRNPDDNDNDNDRASS
jgi:hypothetical protein